MIGPHVLLRDPFKEVPCGILPQHLRIHGEGMEQKHFAVGICISFTSHLSQDGERTSATQSVERCCCGRGGIRAAR